jgi:hypothetical protein
MNNDKVYYPLGNLCHPTCMDCEKATMYPPFILGRDKIGSYVEKVNCEIDDCVEWDEWIAKLQGEN